MALLRGTASSAILPDVVDRSCVTLLLARTLSSANGCGTRSGSSTGSKSYPSTSSAWSTRLCGTWPGEGGWPAHLGGTRWVPDGDPCVRVHDDLWQHRGVPGHRDQCLELGYPAIKLHAFGDAREDAKLCAALREHVGDDFPLMYDGSAGFDLPDAVYLGDALSAPATCGTRSRSGSSPSPPTMAGRAVRVPLLVGETSDGAHMNTADFIASGCASFVRTSAELRGGITGAMRTAHLADAFRLRAEPHGNTITCRHLCMAISNCTYYESLVWGNPIRREAGIDEHGIVAAPGGPGIGLPAGPEYPDALRPFVVAGLN